VNMLLTHPTSDNMDTILITYLSDELTCAQTHFLMNESILKVLH